MILKGLARIATGVCVWSELQRERVIRYWKEAKEIKQRIVQEDPKGQQQRFLEPKYRAGFSFTGQKTHTQGTLSFNNVPFNPFGF